MGKKSQKKSAHAKESTGHTTTGAQLQGKRLPVHKRNELNNLIDQLLKIGFNPTNSPSEQWKQYVDMRVVLDRVQAIENELKIKTIGKSRTAAIEAFYKWAAENGAKFDGVKIQEFSGYELGLEATKDIQEDDLFIKIPKTMLMSLDNVNTALAPMVAELPMIQTMSNVKLAFSLLVERLNPTSKWRPYLDVLPEKYTTVMNFTINEMSELKGSSALQLALTQCKNIARQYAFINKFIQNIKEEQTDATLNLLKERFTYDLYCWAASTIMTRQNVVPSDKITKNINKLTINDNNDTINNENINIINNVEKIPDDNTMAMKTTINNYLNDNNEQLSPALIPFWDMANHQQGIIKTNYNLKTESIESGALKTYKKGEQIFIYYGNRNNTDLLIHNGFIYPGNQNDTITLRLGLSSSDELLKERSKLLESLDIPISGELQLLKSPVFISPKLLGFVRVFNMNKEQITHWLESDRPTDLLHVDCALETSLENKTWSFLYTRLQLLLKSFPTTADEDIALLNGGSTSAALTAAAITTGINYTYIPNNKLGHVRSMLIQFRVIEKFILAEALEYVKQRIKA